MIKVLNTGSWRFAAIIVMLSLGGCATDFVKMNAPTKPVAISSNIEKVQEAAEKADNQPGVVELAKQTKKIIDQANLVYKLQYKAYKTSDHTSPFGPYAEARDLELKIAPEICVLARDARTLYFTAQEGPSSISAEGMALAKQAFGYADTSAKAIALAIAYPYAGIEWDSGFLSKKHQNEINAATKQGNADEKDFNASIQKYVADIAGVQASGIAVASVKPHDDTVTHKITVSVIGKASQSDRDKLASALRKTAKAFPAPDDLFIKVHLKHLGGTSLPSRTTLMLTTFFIYVPIAAEIHGDMNFSASVQQGAGKPIPLFTEKNAMDAMEAKETDHLVTIATYAILSRAVVTAYGEGW